MRNLSKSFAPECLTRRSLLKGSAALPLLNFAGRSSALTRSEPHFFLQILSFGGLDSMYMFDARPLSVKAKSMANYAESEATPWTGQDGSRCLAAEATKPLSAFQERFSIVNGIHMPPGFAGHGQNMSSALTANPFGGEYFAPFGFLPLSKEVDFVLFGSLDEASVTNMERVLSMEAGLAPVLSDIARAAYEEQRAGGGVRHWLRRQAEGCSGGSGMFSKGCGQFADAVMRSEAVVKKLIQQKSYYEESDQLLVKSAKVACAYFKLGMSDIALIADYKMNFDSHSAGAAKSSPGLYIQHFIDLAAVFKVLIDTPFDERRGLSMLDVTTVLISSEFGRTHMQAGKGVEDTGTDHNTFANTAILAGKGIKGGQLIGGTDMQAEEDFKNLSAMHRLIDPHSLSRVGRPYDFEQGQLAAAFPEGYDLDRFITIASIFNSAYSAFGLPQSQWYSNHSGGRSAPLKAKALSKLLT